MATNYPTSIDNGTTLPDPSATNDTNSPSLSSGQTNQNDALIALETYLGTNSSQTTPVNGKFLTSASNGTSIWANTVPSGIVVGTSDSQTLTNKNLISPTINTATINNPTLKTDSVMGYTSSSSGTVYGMSVTSGVLASAAIANSVNTAAIQSSAVTTAKIAANAVTTSLINDGAVTIAKLGPHIAAGSFAAKGSTGNQSITGVGFTPSVVYFFVGIATSSSVSASGFGYMDTSTQYSSSSCARLSTGSQTSTSTSYALKLYSISAGGTFAAEQEAAYVSMDSDGFTINYSTSSTSGDTIGYIAIG